MSTTAIVGIGVDGDADCDGDGDGDGGGGGGGGSDVDTRCGVKSLRAVLKIKLRFSE